MSTIKSLDPRVTRFNINEDEQGMQPLERRDYFETYEVFHQAKRGGRHTHVGSVHAPTPEMAFLFAKEQYGRRSTSTSIWVVRTGDVHTVGDEHSDMWATVPEKQYREAGFYKVRHRIEQFKNRNNDSK